MVHLKGSLHDMAVCRVRETNGDVGNAEGGFESPTHLRQHLDTEGKGHREALKEHEAREAGIKGRGLEREGCGEHHRPHGRRQAIH